eukprot:9482371-Pyramimonas_sp.AAC.1
MRSLRFAVGIWGAMVGPSLPGIEQSLRLTNITVHMCGSPKEPCMARIKAAKTKVLLGWATDIMNLQGGAALLNENADIDNMGSDLLTCCEKMTEFYAVLAGEARVVSADAYPQLDACVSDFAEAWVAAGGATTTKFHIFESHLVQQMREFGNCLHTHNYLDESEQFA